MKPRQWKPSLINRVLPVLPSCVTSDPWRQIWAAISLWGRPLAEKIGIFWPVEKKSWWNYRICHWTSFFKSKILTSGDWIHHINGTNSGLNHFFWVDSGIGINGLTLNGKKFLYSISVLKVGILYLLGCPENLQPLLLVLYLWVFRIRWKFDPACLLKRAFARCRR